jgi:HlyD family secretion protein
VKRKIIKALIICVIASGVGIGGYYGYKAVFSKTTVATSSQYITMTARKMNLEVTIQGTGAAYASNTKDVMPNNNGTLGELTVKVGDTVTAGQSIFAADSDEVRKSVTTAQNNLTKQNLTLASDQSAERVDENKIAMDKLNVSEAKAQLATANANVEKMTVAAPIAGVITAVNNSNGDNVQSGKAVLTIVDMTSIKVKVSVDELDISKVQLGQTAAVKFDALKDKTYEGSVEAIAQIGNSSNNVTTYDVVVAVKDPTGIKLGMNANVNILVESKENALVIPAEALVESNGNKFVMVENTAAGTSTTSTGNNTPSQNSAAQGTGTNGQATTGTRQNATNGQRAQGFKTGQATGGTQNTTAASGRLVPIKTGLETENYIEVLEGVTEGQRLLVTLPQTNSTTTTNTNTNRANMGGFGGGMPQGGFQRN